MRLWLPSLVSLQDGTSAEGQSKTKQESAWLFRLWYTFDHKYPFCALPYRNKKVRHSLLEAQLFELAEHSRQCELSYLPRTIVYNLFVLLPALCSLCNNWCPYWIMTYEGHKVNAFSSSSSCFLPFAQQLPLQVADCVAAFHYYSCVLQWRLSPRSHVLDTAETSGGIVSHCQRYASCRQRVQCDPDLFRVSSFVSIFASNLRVLTAVRYRYCLSQKVLVTRPVGQVAGFSQCVIKGWENTCCTRGACWFTQLNYW